MLEAKLLPYLAIRNRRGAGGRDPLASTISLCEFLADLKVVVKQRLTQAQMGQN